MVVATRDDIDLIDNDFQEAAYAQYPKQTGMFRDLLEKLMDIPPDRRAMAIQQYEIRDKRR